MVKVSRRKSESANLLVVPARNVKREIMTDESAYDFYMVTFWECGDCQKLISFTTKMLKKAKQAYLVEEKEFSAYVYIMKMKAVLVWGAFSSLLVIEYFLYDCLIQMNNWQTGCQSRSSKRK